MEIKLPPKGLAQDRAKEPPRFKVGKEVVPFFAACGTMWEILLDDKRLFVFPGAKVDAQVLAGKLNRLLREVK